MPKNIDDMRTGGSMGKISPTFNIASMISGFTFSLLLAGDRPADRPIVVSEGAASSVYSPENLTKRDIIIMDSIASVQSLYEEHTDTWSLSDLQAHLQEELLSQEIHAHISLTLPEIYLVESDFWAYITVLIDDESFVMSQQKERAEVNQESLRSLFVGFLEGKISLLEHQNDRDKKMLQIRCILEEEKDAMMRHGIGYRFDGEIPVFYRVVDEKKTQ